jgi:hypothetical protein
MKIGQGWFAALTVSAAAGIVHAGTTPAVFFTDPAQFTQQVTSSGKVLKGIEDFEESTIEPGQKIPFSNALQNGVPRPTFEFGIDATNLIIQSNITQAPCAPTPNPSTNQAALWVNGPGFLSSNSVKVGTDEFLNGLFSSIDLIFTSNDKTGVGVDLSTYPGFSNGHGGFIVCAFDSANNVLGTFTLGPTPTEPAKNFIGVWSPVPIARLNVWGIFTAPQPFAVDNIQMWTVPAPGSVSVLALAGLLSARRRRR